MRTLQILLLILFATVAIDAQTVYVTKTGSKYHRDGCRYLSRSKIETTVSSAQAQGFGPCSVCKPPTSAKSTKPVTKQVSTSISTSGNSKTGYITTTIDGNKLSTVKLWDHKIERDEAVTSCTNYQKVTILVESGDYIKCRTEQGKEGWCLKDFVKERE